MPDSFSIPEFLQTYSTEEVMAKMLKRLPDTISKEENGWVCDLFYPVAIALSRVVEFTLTEAVRNIIPKYSYGDILLGHGENRNLFLKEATHAKAKLTITGVAGTKISQGVAFSTVSTPEQSGIIFYTMQECEITETGIAEVESICAEAGKKEMLQPKVLSFWQNQSKELFRLSIKKKPMVVLSRKQKIVFGKELQNLMPI